MNNERESSPEQPEPQYGSALIWKIHQLLDTLPEERVGEGLHDDQIWISSENRVGNWGDSEVDGGLGTEVSIVNKPSSPEVVIDIFTDIILDKDASIEPDISEVDSRAAIPYPGGIQSRKSIVIDRNSGEVSDYRVVSTEIPPSWVECGSGEVISTLDNEMVHSDVSHRDYDEKLHRQTMGILNSLQ